MRHLLAAILVACVFGYDALPVQAADVDATRSRGQASRRRSLAERIPAVTGRVFMKAGRVELTPLASISLDDPFYTMLPVGASVSYHIIEQLSVGVSGEFNIPLMNTGVEISAGGTGTTTNYNRAMYAARLDVSWAPIYGKLSLMAEAVLHFDTYLTASGGVIGPEQSSPAFAWSVAVGQRYFFAEWLALRLEYRNQFFQMARVIKSGINPVESFETLMTFGIGLSFFLPPSFEHETL